MSPVEEATTPTEAAIARVLSRHVPDVLASSMIRRAKEATALSQDPQRLVDELRASVRLFVDLHKQRTLLAELEELRGARVEANPDRVSVAGEADVSRARLRAREICKQLGGTAFGVQRASTAVSELARNIVMYVGSGYIDMVPHAGVPPRLVVRAVDRGPGIAKLETILQGRYRSTTGLGKGLLGVQRMSSRFNIHTGAAGTQVEAEIPL
ncbi:MAG: hypothetical protein U0271_28190 [Polyangiaceae bacterium]